MPINDAPPPSTSIQTNGPSPWLDAEDVAPLLATTPHTLRRLAREDRCPIIVRRIGGRWRFSRRDLERFLNDEPTGDRT